MTVDFASVDAIARAILYEGFLLYPYRESALKNRRPCAFGSLLPRVYSQANGAIESWSMQIECLVSADGPAVLDGAARFLQARRQDADECEVRLSEIDLTALTAKPRTIDFAFPLEGLSPLQGIVELSAERLTSSLLKIRVRIENQTPAGTQDHVMLSTQTILVIEGGRFLSLIDPPASARPYAGACQNRGAWPVLVGDRAQQNLLLAAPIILSDFPEVAPESPGNLFDGTEIDELLTLRILTLSDAEKDALRSNEMARALLERTETLAGDQLLALHGTLRAGKVLSPGDRVRVHPRGRADLLDLALAGKSATIVSVEEDIEGRRYYSLAMDDDPGKDLGVAGKPGHRFFFGADELEMIAGES